MGFLNSLGQVMSNGKNFKEWEKEQQNNTEKRKVLAQKNPKTQEELERAKKQGQVIIDIVDIMDAHSEDVAEKTETATAPFEAIIPYLATIGSFLGSSKFVFTPASKALMEARNKFTDNKEVIELAKKIQNYGYNNDISDLKYFYEYGFLNKKYLDKLKNIDDDEIKAIYKRAQELLKEYQNNPAVKNFNKKIGLGILIPLATALTSFVGTIILATKLQVNSSRIARWQSREQLNDPKYFVQYTPEQIEQAKQTVEAKEQQEKGFSARLFNKKEKSSLIQVIKDNKAYKAWKKQDSDQSKLVQRELTQQELIEAQKDKEVIQRITKLINNRAEDYSENMEVAADTIIMGTPFLGGAIGAIVSFIGNKSGILDKTFNKNIEKLIGQLQDYDAQEVKNVYEKFKNTTKNTPEYKKLAGKLRALILMSDFKVNSGTAFDNLSNAAKKGLNIALSTNKGRNFAFSIIGGIITTTVGLVVGLKLQKASARAGRYLAKRELEQDPNNFIGYSDEELKSVENVKAQKEPFGKRFKEYITFIPRVIGEYFEYKKYQNSTAAKNRAIKEELVKSANVDEKQLKDAKNLQRKMFNTFEKVDDKSQEYSESVEAVTEIAKPLVLLAGIATAISPAAIIGIQVARGKIKAGSVIEKVTKFLSEKTNFLKGKRVKNYLSDVNKNIVELTKDMKATQKVTDEFSEFDIPFDAIKNILKEMKAGIKGMNEKEFFEYINSDYVPYWLRSIAQGSNKKQIDTILDNLEKIGNNIPQKDLEEIFETIKKVVEKDPQKAIELLKDSKNVKNILLTKGIKKVGAITAGTWAALNFVVTFAIESYLAKLQKEAGRLGVMKAMQELDDERFYANSEVDTQNKQVEPAKTTNVENKYLL